MGKRVHNASLNTPVKSLEPTARWRERNDSTKLSCMHTLVDTHTSKTIWAQQVKALAMQD